MTFGRAKARSGIEGTLGVLARPRPAGVVVKEET
jgi:hypothetical protein